MAATLTAYEAALKRVWTQETLESQLYQETVTLSKIEKTKRFTIGEEARVPLHVSRNGGYTVLPEGGGTLNDAGNQGLAKAVYEYTNHHQQIAIQGDVLDRADTSAHTVANVLDTEVNGALTDLRRQLQRQLFGNGDALIAQCRASASNDVDLNLVSGGNAIARGWLYVGLPVDVGTTADEEAIVNGSAITAIDETNTAFTVAAGNVAGEGTTHYVSVKNARDGTTSYEMNGLRNIVSLTAALGGLDPANEARWKASGVDTASQPITLALMLAQDRKIHQSTGRKADTVIMGLKQEGKFYELLHQQVRYASDQAMNAGNVEAPKWHGMNILVDPDCPDEDVYFGQLKSLFIVATDKPYWQNKVTGGNILAWIQGTDSFGAKLTYRINLATNNRRAWTRLGGLS